MTRVGFRVTEARVTLVNRVVALRCATHDETLFPSEAAAATKRPNEHHVIALDDQTSDALVGTLGPTMELSTHFRVVPPADRGWTACRHGVVRPKACLTFRDSPPV